MKKQTLVKLWENVGYYFTWKVVEAKKIKGGILKFYTESHRITFILRKMYVVQFCEHLR